MAYLSAAALPACSQAVVRPLPISGWVAWALVLCPVTPSEKSARLQVAADDEPIAAAGRHEPPGCRTQLQTAPAASPRWTATPLCRSASPSSLSRSAGLRKMSSVLLPNRSILEASKVSGCDGGLHSGPELSALVTRVGGELAQVMRRRRARTCSMRSVGCRLVPSDGGGAPCNS